MKIIGSKAEVKKIFEELTQLENDWDSPRIIEFIHSRILKQKVRFAVLESLAELLHAEMPGKKIDVFLQKIIDLDEIGAYTITGKILQLKIRTDDDLSKNFRLAEKFIIQGDKWYVCDIIGERVYGYSLLMFPGKTISYLKELSSHSNTWMVRCIGVATHYAVKKGLDKKSTADMFELLLTHASASDFHVKKGIGWAAKTIAKFHPAIIKNHENEIYDNKNVKQWFKTKIKIGLSRNSKYAFKYNS